ncbi:META domain-containing protein [Cellulomonas humilata]|uniref:META domain-containing protein n=1 Tax=Cellulomonas humilata TaxID=144055 RepID=A0A7Y6DXT3_9CELL|nr:META domain-containing protein [Cellulomonas humilata]NUU17963.1 META domain-containing protein [Cellulomonas humilata]
MRHSRTSAGLSVVVLALLAGCASSAGSGSGLSAEDVTGEWVEAGSEPRVYLELADDGALSGSDGCNQLTGAWEIDGSEVDFGDLGSTMMACEDVDTWLSGAGSATVSGDELTVLDADGTEIGTLERST